MINVKEKKVTILGAARSGVAVAKLLKAKGADVFVSDISEYAAKKKEAIELELAAVGFEFGGHSERARQADFVVLSPGIPVRSDLVQSFLKNGIPVYSEIEAASWFCLSPIIAVTGSNGKTTTTTLIGEMLKKRYPDAIIAGNIGKPFAACVAESHADSYAVIEVSSFQLETIDGFHPHQALVLNFAPNHLDRYDSYEKYLQAKWRITKNLTTGDRLIYNAIDQRLSDWARDCIAQKEKFAINGDKDAPSYYRDGKIFLLGEELISVKEMGLRGEHNYMNAMAAALAAKNAGVSIEHIRETLADFTGVEHRLEFVREVNGVKFINDSKATTVESLSYALRSFDSPIVLIAGGKDKGSDFTKLNEWIKTNIRDLVLIGSGADQMEEAWKKIKPVHRPGNLRQAVEKAYELAKPGEVVLLSPACASFDMFRDYEDRGRQFKEIVNGLK